MNALEGALAGGALAALTACGLAGVVAWCGPVDPVKARSSHARPTPTSGGLAILAGAAAGIGLLALLQPELGGARPLAMLLTLAAAVGLFGAADDLLDLSAKGKLAAQVIIGVGVAVAVARAEVLPLAPGLSVDLGPWLGGAGTVLFVVVLLNAVNFIDGANGLAPGACAIALLGLAAAGFSTAAGSLLVPGAAFAAMAAGLGFLPWNFPRGRLFQGDVGALFTAAMTAGIGLLYADAGVTTPYFVVFTVLPILTDVLLTLLSRARRRQSLFLAHREHLYQLWLDATGRSHAALAWRAWALTLLCTVIGLWVERAEPELAPLVFAGTVAVLTLGWTLARRALVRRLNA